jgi:hypothetical protein
MSTRIRFRRDTAANWTSNNPTLTTGELGYETDTGKFKIGNNTNAWTALPYSITAELSEGNLNDLKDVTITSAANGDFLRWNGTAWINDAVNLATDTVGSFVESLVAGTGITLTNNSGESATPTIAIGQAVGTGSNVTFNDLTVSGNLTVSGTTTTLNTETLTVNDNIIVLNNNVTGSPSENAGIEVERGTSTNVQIRWNETTDVWEATVNGSAYSPLITDLTLEERFGEEHWHRPADLATAAVLPQTPAYSAGSADLDGGTGIGATLTGSSNARLVVDGVNASTGNRILVKNQADAKQNGLYDVTAQGSVSAAYVLTRAVDFNGSTAGQITINETIGASNGDVNHLQTFATSSSGSGTNGAHIIGTDNITLQQTTGPGFQFDVGTGLSNTNNTINVATASSSRIVANADSIDLAEVSRTNSSGSATSTFMTSVTTDAYGRVTASTTAEASIALGTQTTGDYVASITGGTGVTSSAAISGETTAHTLSIGQAVGTGDSVSFANLYLTGGITMEGTTANDFEVVINAGDPTADRTVTLPNATGTVALTSDLTPYATLASPTFTGIVVLPSTTSIGTITETELSYVDGVTSSIQTQINTKAPSASPTFTGTVVLPDNTVALGTKTTGDYVATITGGTGVTSTAATTGEGTTHTLSIGQAVGTASNVTFNDLTVSGNLTVSGTTTSINTATLNVADNIVILNNDVTGTPTENAGIEVERGTSANVLVRWNETTDKWEATNDGTTYGNIVTTADSGTVSFGMIADVSTSAQSASYTLVLADKNKVVEMSVATANTLTVPPNASVAFPVGSQINVLQTNTGQCTITAGAGVTVNGTPGLKLRTQWSYVTLIKRATDTWVVVGDLSA